MVSQLLFGNVLSCVHTGLLQGQVYAAKVKGKKQDKEIFASQSFCRACRSKRALLGEGGAPWEEEVVARLRTAPSFSHGTWALGSK